MILNIVLFFIILLLGLMCLVLALRCFGITELPIGRRTLVLEKRTALTGEAFTPVMGLTAVLWGLGALLAMYGVSALYCAVFQESLSWTELANAWSHWDAKHYIKLAELGYHDYVEDGQHLFLVFFPLYPWLVRLLHSMIDSYALCGHLLSGACFTAGCYVLARLVTEDFGWRAARLSLALTAAYPFAFFFAAMYTESLFFLLSVTVFYCIRKHRWLWAGLFGALAALTRMQGVLLTAAALVEYAGTEHPIQKLGRRDWRGLWRDVWRRLAPLAIVAVGVAVYLWLNYAVEGDPFRFTYYQKEHWSQGFKPLPDCLRIIWNNLTDKWGERLMFTTWGPDLAVFILCLAAAVYGVRRLPPAWMAYFLLCIFLNYSLSWPLSCGRYMTCTFPLFVTAAVAGQKRPALTQFAAGAGALMQGAYLMAYLSGSSVF